MGSGGGAGGTRLKPLLLHLSFALLPYKRSLVSSMRCLCIVLLLVKIHGGGGLAGAPMSTVDALASCPD